MPKMAGFVRSQSLKGFGGGNYRDYAGIVLMFSSRVRAHAGAGIPLRARGGEIRIGHSHT